MRQSLPLPVALGPVGRGSLVVGATGLGIALGALPLQIAAAVAVGIPAVAITLTRPRVTLVLLLFSIPFSGWTRIGVGSLDLTSIDILAAILIAGWVLRSIVEHRMTIHGGATIGAACLVLAAEIVSSSTAVSFPAALKEMIKLGELIVVAAFAASTLRATEDLPFVVWTFLAAGVCEAFVGLFQFVTGRGPETFAIGPFIRAYGDFAQPNAFAGYLAMVLPFGLVWTLHTTRYRPAALLATGILGVAILASLSRGAWLGTALGIAAMGLVWSPATKRVLALGSALLLLLIPAARVGIIPASIADRMSVLFENYFVFDVRTVQPDPSNWAIVERMAHWQAGWDMAMAYPLTGVGPGNYETVYPDFYLGTWVEPLGHAHNLYLNMFAELGIVGLIAFVTFTVMIFVRIFQGLRQTAGADPAFDEGERRLRRALLVGALGAAVTFSVHNTFDNMFIHGMGVQFGLILGLVEAQLGVLAKKESAAIPISQTSTQ